MAIEVKLAQAVGDGDVRQLRWLADRIGDDLVDGLVITTGAEAYRRPDGIGVVPAASAGALRARSAREASPALCPCSRGTNMCSMADGPLRRAARALGLQLPRRRVGPRGDGRAGGRAGPRGPRPHRPRRALRLAGLRPRRPRGRGAPDHGGRADAARRRPPHAAGRRRGAGYANLCRLITLAHADTRPPPDRRALPPALDRAALAAHAEGLVCLTGCARHGLVPRLVAAGRRREALEAAARRWRATSARGTSTSRSSTRATAATGAWRATWPSWPRRPGCAASPPATPTPTTPRAAFLQDAFVAIRHRLTLDGSEDAAARQPPGGAADARPRRPRASPTTPRPSPRPCAWPSASSSTSRATSATASPTSRAPTPARPPRRRWRASAPTSSARATPTPASAAAARERLDEELALIEHHDLAGFFLLHRDILELAREVALRARPAGSARRWLPPGRGRGSSVGSIVCYLTGLSHVDPVENGLFLGPLPQPRHGVGARHRPRLPPRRARAAHRGGDRRATAPSTPRWWRPSPPSASAWPSASWAAPWPCPRPTWSAWRGCRTAGRRRGRWRRSWRGCPTGEAKLASPRWRALAVLAREAAGLPRHLSQHSGRHGGERAAAGGAGAGGAGRLPRPPDLPVGQGLLRRRRVREDRPARPGDAVGGRGVHRPDRPLARRERRPVAHRLRRPRRLRRDPGRRHGRRVPDREPGPDAEPAPDAPREPGGPHDPGGPHPPRAGQRRGGAPLREAPPRPARRPGVRAPLRPPPAGRLPARDARGGGLPGAGARGGDGAGRLHPRPGRGAAARDEPQAQPRGDGRPVAGVPRRRPRARGGRRDHPDGLHAS